MSINYIDFTKLPKYSKKLPPAQPYNDIIKTLQNYFDNHSQYSVYSLAAAFDMSVRRWKKLYLNSDDKHVKEIIDLALTAITAHAFDNADLKYGKTLKYIIAMTELGQPFLEKEVQTQESKQIIILPAKG